MLIHLLLQVRPGSEEGGRISSQGSVLTHPGEWSLRRPDGKALQDERWGSFNNNPKTARKETKMKEEEEEEEDHLEIMSLERQIDPLQCIHLIWIPIQTDKLRR